MNDSIYSWIFFGIYIAGIIGITLWGKRKAKSMESFAIGTRTVSPIFIGLSLAANLTSAATFVINPGLLYLYGWSGFLGYAVAAPLGIFLALTIFSKSFRKIGDKFTVLTVPQWIGDRYGDNRLKIYFAFISLLQITFLVLIVVGLTQVLSSALGIPFEYALTFIIIFTFTYILLGGASTHIMTNTVQAGIMIVVAFILIGSGFKFFTAGISGFFEKMSLVDTYYSSVPNPESLLFRSYFEVFFANFIVGVAIIMQPHVISKALYLRTEGDVNKYLLTAIITASLFFLVLITGIFARLAMGGEVLPPDQVIATYIVREFSPLIRAVISFGILAAGFSTMEGILVALSSIFSNDFLKNILPVQAVSAEQWKQRSLKAAKIFLVILAPVTFYLSYQQIVSPSLSVAIFAQNGVYGLFSATFVPVLFGIFSQRISKGVIFTASIAALLVHFGMYYGEITMYHNNPAVPATCAVITSLIVATIGMFVTRSNKYDSN